MEQATAAQPGERLKRFETNCGLRGGCERVAIEQRRRSVDLVCGLPNGLRRLRNRGQSDPGVRKGALTTFRNVVNAFTLSCAARA